jgi:hypothetical protein
VTGGCAAAASCPGPGPQDHTQEVSLRAFSDQRFEGRASVIEGVTAVRCTIAGIMPPPRRAGDWNRLRECRAVQCSHENASLYGVAIERCELDGLKRAGPSPLYLFACVFDRVRLAGRLAAIKINPEYDMLECHPAAQARWVAAMRAFYEGVEWALDISEAAFGSAPSLEAIPGHLVRRDPSRHVLVRREALAGRDIRSLPGHHAAALEWFVERSPFDSVVLVGSCEQARRQRDLDGLRHLRDVGIADPE